MQEEIEDGASVVVVVDKDGPVVVDVDAVEKDGAAVTIDVGCVADVSLSHPIFVAVSVSMAAAAVSAVVVAVVEAKFEAFCGERVELTKVFISTGSSTG